MKLEELSKLVDICRDLGIDTLGELKAFLTAKQKTVRNILEGDRQ